MNDFTELEEIEKLVMSDTEFRSKYRIFGKNDIEYTKKTKSNGRNNDGYCKSIRAPERTDSKNR